MHVEEKYFDDSPCCEENLQDIQVSSQVEPDLHDSAAPLSSFSCFSNKFALLHVPVQVLSVLPLTSYVKCV